MNEHGSLSEVSDAGEVKAAGPACPVVPHNELFAAVVASTDDGVYTVTLDGVLTSWNAGAERLYGYSAAEVIGQHVSMLTGYVNQAEADEWLARLRSGERIERQAVERRHKDGHTLFVSLTLSPLRIADGTIAGSSTIARDIGPERALQQLLGETTNRAEEQASRFDAVLRSTPDHLYLYDGEGRFVYASDSALKSLGMALTDLVGKTVHEVGFPAGFADILDEQRDAAARDGLVGAGEVTFPTAEGARDFDYTVVPVLGGGEDNAASVVTVRDVTERNRTAVTLAAEKAFSDAIIDAAPGFFYTMDREGRLVRWNSALQDALRDVPGGVAGLSLLDLLDEGQRSAVQEAIAAVMETGAGEVQVRLPLPGGEQADYVMTGRRVEISGAPYLVGFGMDVTARVRAEAEARSARDDLERRVEERTAELRAANRRLKRTERALLTLSWSNQTLVRASDPQRLVQDVCDAAIEIGGYRMAWVGRVEHDDAKTVVPLAFAGAEDGFFSEVTVGWGEGPNGQGSVGRSIRGVRPVLVDDIAAESSLSLWHDVARRHGFGSVLSLPLVDREGVTFGVFCLCASEPGAFDDREIALLEELAMDLSFGIGSLASRTERDEAEERLRDSYGRLETMTHDVVVSMGRIVEARDPYTQGHERRVAELSKAIGAEMGLSADDIAAVEMAAMLHDIGKLCVPAEILTKPGTLSISEFELIKDHSRRGYEILKDIAFPWPIADIVLQHHERVDGSGYPSGLKGAEILLASRILAVADVVEAMASHRPYRPLIGLAQAMEEIHERVAAYDPDVVAACERLYQRGEIDLQ
jgi:PAS domain S-box-containing protein/putative nucleotidyltransferase with HDIG domain